MVGAEQEVQKAIERDGFAVVPEVLTPAQIDRLRNVLDERPDIARARRAGAVYGARNLLDLAAVRDLAADPAVRRLVKRILEATAIPVRAIFFDKTPEANWPVL